MCIDIYHDNKKKQNFSVYIREYNTWVYMSAINSLSFKVFIIFVNKLENGGKNLL